VTTYLSVQVGESAQGYQVANFLSALDVIVCFFSSERIGNDNQIADALELYARHLRDG
jgi:hypothetical protein